MLPLSLDLPTSPGQTSHPVPGQEAPSCRKHARSGMVAEHNSSTLPEELIKERAHIENLINTPDNQCRDPLMDRIGDLEKYVEEKSNEVNMRIDAEIKDNNSWAACNETFPHTQQTTTAQPTKTDSTFPRLQRKLPSTMGPLSQCASQ